MDVSETYRIVGILGGEGAVLCHGGLWCVVSIKVYRWWG